LLAQAHAFDQDLVAQKYIIRQKNKSRNRKKKKDSNAVQIIQAQLYGFTCERKIPAVRIFLK
jgi:hypothetical protein